MSITIRLKRNGPYVIAAEETDQVTIIDADGSTLVPEPGRSITLCRCGGSATKPFCDRTHRLNGFDGTSARSACGESPPNQPATVRDPGPPGA